MTPNIDATDLSVTVNMAGAPITVGEMLQLSPSELGMRLLRGMVVSGRSWSAPNIRAHAEASLLTAIPRRHGSVTRDLSGMIEVIVATIADGLGWLISNSLIGPSSAQSGSGDEWIPTQAGREANVLGSTAHVDATRRLHVDLHPRLQGAARMNFERGEYAAAVLIAMKEVEISLRTASGLPAGLTGKALAQEALKPGGPLRIAGETPDEQTGFLLLFQGAFAAFRNPAGHRAVEYDDPADAANILHFADELLRIIDREKRSRSDN
ncbi:TIGR02391 family protein [Leifsonia sp. NPDC077715]|uniref:TIGR02391 family protein n=1 Tax=Leifsonia sp. NPDC077715 TaxID=3155539 RepID=UPI0034400F7E